MQDFSINQPILRQAELRRLEESLGHVFGDVAPLRRALTHTSYANERGLGDAHNERQEFLGDAVMELCISAELYSRFPEAREGDLTRLRSMLVSTSSFADMARETGIASLVFLGRGEEAQGGRDRDTVLSDVFEAVMAAVYEDGGFPAAQKVVARIFRNRWPESHLAGLRANDGKTTLQEIVQHAFPGQRPVYMPVDCTGPSHARVFTVSLTLPDGRSWQASGTSCKKAEQAAAAMALEALEKEGGKGSSSPRGASGRTEASSAVSLPENPSQTSEENVSQVLSAHEGLAPETVVQTRTQDAGKAIGVKSPFRKGKAGDSSKKTLAGKASGRKRAAQRASSLPSARRPDGRTVPAREGKASSKVDAAGGSAEERKPF